MIIEWINKKFDATRLAGAIKKDALIQLHQKALDEWRKAYFRDIIFPIILLDEEDYIAVSSLELYYDDIDIHRWVESNVEMIDSTGNTYKLANFEKGQWVPIEKTGTIHFEDLRIRLKPMLLLPKHMKEIGAAKNIQEIITLLCSY
jgi:hypothetical protein